MVSIPGSTVRTGAWVKRLKRVLKTHSGTCLGCGRISMASLLIPDFYPLRADAGSTEPVILGQTDLSIPYPWIRWLELLYRFRGYIDVTSFLLRRPEVMVLLFEVYA